MVRKQIKSASLDSQQVTVAGSASVPLTNSSFTPIDNIDGTVDYLYNPEKENATITVAVNNETRKLIDRLSKITGWTATLFFRDNTVAQISQCALVSIPSLADEGEADIEIHGITRWL